MNGYQSNLTGNQIDTGINNTNTLSNNLSTLTTNFNNLNTSFNNLTPIVSLNQLSQIPENNDLNDYITPGQYGIAYNSTAATITNIPIQMAGILYVYSPMGADIDINYGWNYICQRYLDYYYFREYKRIGYTNDTPGTLIWEPWQKIVTVNEIYPVGAIYISTVSTHPATLFGGTWEQIAGKFLLACDQTYTAGATGGSSTHSHQYGLQYGGFYYHTVLENDSSAGVLSWDTNGNLSLGTTTTTGSATSSAPSNSGSGSTSMNHYRTIGDTSYTSNMPPYLSVYMWKRTA